MEVANILKDLSKNHPTIMYSTLKGYDKLKPLVKENYAPNYHDGDCEICGEPSSNKLCRACTFLKELGKKVNI